MDKVLILKGIVSEYEADEDFRPDAIKIGDGDVIEMIMELFTEWSKVVVGICDEFFSGELFYETGWGYSEYTWMDSDSLSLNTSNNKINLLQKLRDRIGENITMIISNSPINLLEYLIEIENG